MDVGVVEFEFDMEGVVGLDHLGHLALSSQTGSHCAAGFGVGAKVVERIDVDGWVFFGASSASAYAR